MSKRARFAEKSKPELGGVRVCRLIFQMLFLSTCTMEKGCVAHLFSNLAAAPWSQQIPVPLEEHSAL